ncbi:MAG: hypothetical protein KDA89_07325, partial [Planctomycetaceae bacterium]|nr:hypothetical protein [Planctomycetaceae bacterium]
MALVFPNLTFEDELTGRTDAPTPETLRALSELAPLMALVGDAGDILAVSESGLPSGCPAVLSHVNFRSFDDAVSAGPFDRILPWGWTSVVRPLAEKCGVAAADIPNAEAVEIVNSRRFSAEFDPVYCEDPSDLPFGAEHFGQLCRSEEQWHDVVSRLTDAGYDRWVAKPQISHAGRNRLLANRHELNDQQYGWLRKHLAHPAGVYVEPWVQPMLEAGLQFDICRVPDEVADTTTTSTCDDADSGSFSSVESVRRQMSAEFHDELLSPETQVPCEIPYRSAHANVVIRFSGATGLINDHVGRFLGSTVCADGSIEHFWRDA